MPSLYSFLMEFEPAWEDDITISGEASILIASGVFPCRLQRLGLDTQVTFSSRLPRQRAFRLAQRYCKNRFGDAGKIIKDDDYDFRGYFTVSLVES